MVRAGGRGGEKENVGYSALVVYFVFAARSYGQGVALLRSRTRKKPLRIRVFLKAAFCLEI